MFRTPKSPDLTQLAWWIVALVIPAIAQASVLLETISDVRNLSAEEAAESRAVDLEGQIVRIHPRGLGFFLYDGEAGIYIDPMSPREAYEGIVAGDVVRIVGNTRPGHFIPSIKPQAVDRIGHEPLPEARPFFLYQRFDTKIDSDWVSVMGRLTSVAVLDAFDVIVIGLDLNGIPAYAQLPNSDEGLERVRELMFHLVRFDAVAGSVYNKKRQLTGRIFFMNSAEDLVPLRGDDFQDEAPVYAIHELMRVGARLRQLVETRGVVTYVSENELFLRGEQASIKVVTRETPEVTVGDTVVVRGLVWPQPVSPAFRAIEVERVATEGSLEAKDVMFGHEIDSNLNFELIQVEAELVDIGKSFELSILDVEGQERVSLLCRSGPHLFEAFLPPGVLPKGIEPGAKLSLTGICQLKVDSRARWFLYIEGLSLQLRGLNDIEVLTAAPWWTTARLLSLLGVALAFIILFLVWVVLLRRTVEKQTALISDQIERQTILDERQRIARELHDNLEQGLAAMAIQLRGVFKLLQRVSSKAMNSIQHAIELGDPSNETLRSHLKGRLKEVAADSAQSERSLSTAQDMLGYCSEEARSAILDLRGGLLERMDLPSALEVALEPIAEASGARVLVQSSGTVRRLRNIVERNLLMVGREAVTNAIRHGSPREITVSIEYSENSLSLSITDDGVGFDSKAGSKTGHFGLIGMHERVESLKGTIEIKSEASKGTRIFVELPDTSEWEKT
ncbi:MAG: ATP-binding protein [Opitutaceae bacterium]